MACFAEELIDIYTKKREVILTNKEKEDHDSTKNGYVSLPKVSRDYQKRWTYMECL